MTVKTTDNSANDTKNASDHTITVKPGEQLKVTLGEYTSKNAPKGFSIDFDPLPRPKRAVETQIASVGTDEHYKMILFIANYGTRAVTAEVRQL
jgi:hypothetical protein